MDQKGHKMDQKGLKYMKKGFWDQKNCFYAIFGTSGTSEKSGHFLNHLESWK